MIFSSVFFVLEIIVLEIVVFKIIVLKVIVLKPIVIIHVNVYSKDCDITFMNLWFLPFDF